LGGRGKGVRPSMELLFYKKITSINRDTNVLEREDTQLSDRGKEKRTSGTDKTIKREG